MTSELTRRDFAQRALLMASAPLFGVGSPIASSAKPESYPSIHYDEDGLIVHKKGLNGSLDGGDTCQREGWYWFGRWIREKMQDPWPIKRERTFAEVVGLLEPKSDGIFYRHPKLAPWNNPYDKDYGFSRDQMLPIMAALGVWSQSDASLGEPLRRLWNALPQDQLGGTKHTFNGSWWPSDQYGRLVYTGDIVGPATINLYRRALNQDPMKANDGNGPNGERELAVNVALRLDAAKDRDNTGDDLNLIIMLLLASFRFPNIDPIGVPPLPVLPSLPDLPKPLVDLFGRPDWRVPPLPPLSIFSAWLPSSITTERLLDAYKQRPLSYGSYLSAYREHCGGGDLTATARKCMDDGISRGWKPEAKGVLGAIRWYHREETGANPALAGLYEPIVRKYLE